VDAKVLKSFIGSKKFIVFAASVVVLAANDLLGIALDQSTVEGVITVAAAYMVGQGAADIGKERAKIEREQ
jgi:hypothetical protein